VRLDGLTGRLGGGDVRFGGRIGFKGFAPDEYGITATGRDMRIRYPEGFRSLVDADLALRGSVASPTLSGTVTVKSATWNGSFDAVGSGVFKVQGAEAARAASPAAPAARGFPLNFDVRVDAPGTLRIENRAARLVSSADLTLRGTYDKPLLFGRVEVLRGEVLFEGNRYQVTRGTFDFANPKKIEPFFDIEAETRVRVPGETYRVTFHVSGTPDRLGRPELTSDPPLSEVDILTLLFGDPRNPADPELRNLRAPGQAEQDLVTARAARLLASPVSSEVSRVVEQTLGVDAVQITPSLGDVWTQQLDQLTPSARLTIGKRLSERVFLTYAQAISATTTNQVIQVEYNQSDRLSWVLAQNEDRTYSLNVRVRHVF
jgi:translocation and assembly module TamB